MEKKQKRGATLGK